MQDTIKKEIHDFIMKSYKKLSLNCRLDRNDKIVVRNVSAIEKYFLEGARPIEIKKEFAIATTDNKHDITDVWDITDRYLAHLSFVARHDGYTLNELNLISTLLGARRCHRKEIIDCVNTINKCKNGYKQTIDECKQTIDECKDECKQNNLVFSISDPIVKLYDLNIISTRTLCCLLPTYFYKQEKPKDTIEKIIYAPKMWLYGNITNMGDKRIGEIVSFMNNYTIQGRIIPTKEDIKRVLVNAIDTTVVDNDNIINMYFLTDMSVNNMCEHLQLELSYIQSFIDRVLMRVCESACKNEWGLLDLITLSSMIDLCSARQGTYKPRYYYKPRNYYLEYITGRIIDLLANKNKD
jgi:hypothetical protein